MNWDDWRQLKVGLLDLDNPDHLFLFFCNKNTRQALQEILKSDKAIFYCEYINILIEKII